ncbi:vascular cell adhesion protein 1-like [Aulostomus maculatus]
MALRMLGLLMLMILLCDAESLCPTEINPLTLNPPEVVAEMNEAFEVNCTSTVEDHDGMSWIVANNVFVEEEEENFIQLQWKTLGWNEEALCKIKLNRSHDCTKQLNITVYKNPEAVHLFRTNYNDSVEQNMLQCDIISVAPVQNLVVRWYKDNDLITTNSSTNTSKTPVSESFLLMVSKEDDKAEFRCEAQLDFGKDGPQLPVYPSDTVRVSLHYAPELLGDNDVIFCVEGCNITLYCSANANPPPTFHWTHDGMVISATNQSLDIYGLINDATYSCTSTNYLGSVTKQLQINMLRNVQAKAPAPVTPTPVLTTTADCSQTLTLTPAEIVVRFGDPASINCSTSDSGFSGMGWEASEGGTGHANVSEVTWRVDKVEDWDLGPLCYISFENHQCVLSPLITLYKTPDDVFVTWSHSGPMVEGKYYVLTCNIINVAPLNKLHVTWYKGDKIVYTEMFDDRSRRPENVSSILRVTPYQDDDGAKFSCKAELHLGPKGPETPPTASSLPVTFAVEYKPVIRDCPRSFSGVEEQFSLNMVPCAAAGNPPPAVRWYRQGNLLNASEPLQRSQSGEFTVHFVNNFGTSSASVDITVEYGASIRCQPRYEVRENDGPPCEAEGRPTPVITWLKDGKETTSPPRWTKQDSGEYQLTAINNHGAANHTLYIDVLYAPVFKEGNLDKEMAPGENVTLDCSAEGNPAPVMAWKYTPAENIRETTRGSQENIIIITGATSTNAGVYECVANNKVGVVSRSITLIMKERSSGVLIIIVLALILVFLLILIAICFSQKKKKHGQYSFVETNGTDIPLTTNPVDTKA